MQVIQEPVDEERQLVVVLNYRPSNTKPQSIVDNSLNVKHDLCLEGSAQEIKQEGEGYDCKKSFQANGNTAMFKERRGNGRKGNALLGFWDKCL